MPCYSQRRLPHTSRCLHVPGKKVTTSRREFLKRTAATGIASASFRSFSGASEATGLEGSPGKAGTVQTVLGTLDPSELGFTLTHEHIADAPDVSKRWAKARGRRADFVAAAVAHLK